MQITSIAQQGGAELGVLVLSETRAELEEP